MQRLLILLVLCSLGFPAAAHKPGDSYLHMRVDGGTVDVRWDIALRDLDFVIGLDGNDDGAVTWGELRARQSAIFAHALSRLGLGNEQAACTGQARELRVDHHSDGAYAALRFAFDCGPVVKQLTVTYNLLFDVDTLHRGLVRMDHNGTTQTAVLSPAQRQHQFSLSATDSWQSFSGFVRDGVWHIWRGFDHILFLVSLLLPAVLVRQNNQWRPVPNLTPALKDVIKTVTAFTIAHSITLCLAVLGLVSLPARWVEMAIAVSVIVVAFNNIVPVINTRRWILAFVFGLVHGLGFANVLTDLNLPGRVLAEALFGFNAGVELGQLAIVITFLPLAYVIRDSWFYRQLTFRYGSVMVMALACAWLVERSFDISLPNIIQLANQILH